KQSWPELVGVRGEVAEATIESENPGVDAVIVLEGTPGDTQFRCDRVRIMVDENGIVTVVPRVG
ncbi:Proteinase inhibitor, partial [Trema orientale]